VALLRILSQVARFPHAYSTKMNHVQHHDADVELLWIDHASGLLFGSMLLGGTDRKESLRCLLG
jgi:hypothetical protein